MTISDFLTLIGQTVKGVVKLCAQSRPTTLKPSSQKQSIIVMGNGPSLKDTIANQADVLAKHPTLAVNFAANAPQFAHLHPQYYILVDPFFFSGGTADNLVRLWQNLAAVSWEMTLIVPRKYACRIPAEVSAKSNITLKTINCVGVEGFDWFENLAYSSRLAMPRPRNVLIPAIMAAIWLGYNDIYIVGADHSWMQSIWVDDQNRVVSVQPHFYKDDSKEQQRVNSEYAGYHLHQIINSFYVAFRSYHRIQRFAASHGVHIYNATPGSFIDAFARKPIG